MPKKDAKPLVVPISAESSVGQLQHLDDAPTGDLADVPLAELAREVLARLQRPPSFSIDYGSTQLGYRLFDALERELDVHANRCGRKHFADMFALSHGHCVEKPQLRGATFVELGCGNINPGGLAFLYLLLGARRAYAIDLDEVSDVPLAVRALAFLAGMLLVDPRSIVGDHAITRADVARALDGFDLGRMRAGDLSGVDGDRLRYRCESAYRTSLGDGEADVVFSNAFLEHIEDLDRCVSELARITKSGGWSVHNVDLTDHRHYAEALHPLYFLTLAEGSPMVHGSNRLRAPEVCAPFERHGFEIVGKLTWDTVPVTDKLRATFVPPFATMPLEELSRKQVHLVCRRR